MVEVDIVALTNSVKEARKNNSPEQSFSRLYRAGIIDKNGDLTPYYQEKSKGASLLKRRHIAVAQ